MSNLDIAIKRTRTLYQKSLSPSVIGRPGYVYLMRLVTHRNAYLCPYKIGQSIDPYMRRNQIATKLPFELELTHTFSTDNMDAAEYGLHVACEDMRLQDEWFQLNREVIGTIINIYSFVDGVYHIHLDDINLPHDVWDGVIDLPF